MAAGERLGKFWERYLLNGSSNLLHVWFYGGVIGIGGSIGTICVSIKSEMTPMKDTYITRFFITWNNSSPMNASQHSSRFTGSNNEYTLSEPSTVVHSTDWLHLDTFWPTEHALPQTTRLLNTWKDGFAIRQVRILTICTGSNHEYKLSEPTAVANIAAWIYLRTLLSVEDTLPRSTRFFNTWKNSSPMNASQYSSRFTGSHHGYTLSEPSAVVHSTDWLHLDTFWPMEHALPQTTRHLNTWKDGFAVFNHLWNSKTFKQKDSSGFRRVHFRWRRLWFCSMVYRAITMIQSRCAVFHRLH